MNLEVDILPSSFSRRTHDKFSVISCNHLISKTATEYYALLTTQENIVIHLRLFFSNLVSERSVALPNEIRQECHVMKAERVKLEVLPYTPSSITSVEMKILNACNNIEILLQKREQIKANAVEEFSDNIIYVGQKIFIPISCVGFENGVALKIVQISVISSDGRLLCENVGKLRNHSQVVFREALANDYKLSGKYTIKLWSETILNILNDCEKLVNEVKVKTWKQPVNILLTGIQKSGKTTLASEIAAKGNFKKVCYLSPHLLQSVNDDNMLPQLLYKSFNDLTMSYYCCLILDNIDEFYSQQHAMVALQYILNRDEGDLIVICVTNNGVRFYESLCKFTYIAHLPLISKVEEIMNILNDSRLFSESDLALMKSYFITNTFSFGIKEIVEKLNCVRDSENPTDCVNEFVLENVQNNFATLNIK